MNDHRQNIPQQNQRPLTPEEYNNQQQYYDDTRFVEETENVTYDENGDASPSPQQTGHNEQYQQEYPQEDETRPQEEVVETAFEEEVIGPREPVQGGFTDGKGLCAKKLAKSYKKRKVVSDVSLNVHRGEAVGLLGPNGAGKTTSFYMIVGLVQPDHGMITLDNADITQLPMYRRARLGVGYLPQEASIFRGLNVEQNILAALEVIESDPDKRHEMLDQLLDEFGITRLRNSPSLALSGGERRRLEIARALASQPNYILLDEPFAGVDPIAVSEIRELVSHLKDRGIGVLITDHNVRETLGVIDRAYIMHSGTVLTQGLPEEIVQHEGVRRVYLGENFSL